MFPNCHLPVRSLLYYTTAPITPFRRARPIKKVTGHIGGLKPAQKKRLERTFHKRVSPTAIINPPLAQHIAAISSEIGRQIGVLINRRGQIEFVFVGDAKRIYLPDIGRQRAGVTSLRGLRHIHTVLGEPCLSRDDLADLTKLRFDLVATLGVSPDGQPKALTYAHILPDAQAGQTEGHAVEQTTLRSYNNSTLDFLALVQNLEKELGRQRQHRKANDHRFRAVIVAVYRDRTNAEWRIAELQELAATAGVRIEDVVTQVRPRVDSKFVVGRGKLEEIVLQCLDLDIDLIIFDHNLTPTQARSIASFSELKVIDRTQLILDIFAQHASSRDGKLQVELAQLKYNLPRLTDLDAGLSRLTGGIGGRGPGETKLEINRRRARERVTKLERQIKQLSQQRHLRRNRRQSSRVPIVSVVGYTNAGKSTLLNRLTTSDVMVADQLFATLDPTSRRLRFPREREAIITDTVGFIRDLPPDLIRAFRATLEELEEADLLLHVADISDPMLNHKLEAVQTLIQELSLDQIPQLLILNKTDRVEPLVARALGLKHSAVTVSAHTASGLNNLVDSIAETLWALPSPKQNIVLWAD